MTNAELIKALRQRSEAKESELTFAWLYETQGTMSQAADALEAAEKRIAELKESNKMLKNTIDADKGVMLDRIRFLEAQLPKESKWTTKRTWNHDGEIYCPVCDHDAPTEGDYRQVKTNYCPNCGAKMKGE